MAAALAFPPHQESLRSSTHRQAGRDRAEPEGPAGQVGPRLPLGPEVAPRQPVGGKDEVGAREQPPPAGERPVEPERDRRPCALHGGEAVVARPGAGPGVAPHRVQGEAQVVGGDRRAVGPAGVPPERERGRGPVRRRPDRLFVDEPTHGPPGRVDPEQLRQHLPEHRRPGGRAGFRVEGVEAGRLLGHAEPDRPRPEGRPPARRSAGGRRHAGAGRLLVSGAAADQGPDPEPARHEGQADDQDGGPQPPGPGVHFDLDDTDTPAPSNVPIGSSSKPFTRDDATSRFSSWATGTTTNWSSTSCSALRYSPSRLAGSASARAAVSRLVDLRVWPARSGCPATTTRTAA